MKTTHKEFNVQTGEETITERDETAAEKKEREAFIVKQAELAAESEAKAQAKATGKALSNHKILGIWSSPLTRCIQTSEELFEETSAQDIYLHDSLLEVLGGGHVCNYRKTRKELKTLYPHCNMENLPDYTPMWVHRENEFSVTNRMMGICLLLAEIYKDSPPDSYLVLTSHWGAIRALTGKALNNAEYVIQTLDEILKRE